LAMNLYCIRYSHSPARGGRPLEILPRLPEKFV